MEYRENCLCVAVLCTIIIVHKGTSSSYGLSTVSGFDLAWFSSCLPSASVSSVFVVLYISILKIFCLHPSLYHLVTLSLVGLALDLVDYLSSFSATKLLVGSSDL